MSISGSTIWEIGPKLAQILGVFFLKFLTRFLKSFSMMGFLLCWYICDRQNEKNSPRFMANVFVRFNVYKKVKSIFLLPATS